MSYFERAVLSGVAVVALAGFSAPASAVTMQAVYTGTVSASYDETGLFGLGANVSLDGLAYELSFIYDPATPGAGRQTDATIDQVLGGNGLGFVNPMISAILTINGHSESVGGDQISLVENYNESDGDPANDFSQSVQLAQDFTDDGLTEVQRRFLGFAFANALVIPVDLETAFSLDLLPPDTGGGSFVLTSYDHILGQSNYYANGSLNPTHLTVSRFGDVAAVPLPAALPLLLSGIAGLGILSRRRRSKAAA